MSWKSISEIDQLQEPLFFFCVQLNGILFCCTWGKAGIFHNKKICFRGDSESAWGCKITQDSEDKCNLLVEQWKLNKEKDLNFWRNHWLAWHHSWDKKNLEVKDVWNVLLCYDIISFKQFLTKHLQRSTKFCQLLQSMLILLL